MKARLIETKRLRLVRLDSSFSSLDYVKWLNNYKVYKYLESGGNYSIEKLENYLLDVEKKNIYFWAITLKHNNKHIGNIKIDPINEKHNTAEYGIMIGDTNEWGKGYAKEATIKVLEECFNKIGIRKITLGYIESNTSAQRLYDKLGFKREGLLIKQVLVDSKYENVVRMGLFKDDFKYD